MNNIIIYNVKVICTLMLIVCLFYIFIIKDIRQYIIHSDIIKRMLINDSIVDRNFFTYTGAYIGMSIFCLGILIKGYNETNKIIYLAYLIDIFCFLLKFLIFLIISYGISVAFLFYK